MTAPVVPSTTTTTTSVADEAAAQHALSEIRRKALESMMKRRKPKDSPTPTPPSTGTPTVPEAMPVDEVSATIEQNILELEHEVQRQAQEQSAVADQEVVMVIDEPEDGEIVVVDDLTPPPPAVVDTPPARESPSLSAASVVPSARQPSRRGTKRPAAEDLGNKPVTSIPRFRKKWGPPQRASKLIIRLDDSDDSSDEDEAPKGPPPMGIDLVQEKEEQIRLLKEKIAAKMKEKLMARVTKKDQDTTTAPGQSTEVPAAVSDAVDVAVSEVPDHKLQAKLNEMEERMEIEPTAESAPGSLMSKRR